MTLPQSCRLPLASATAPINVTRSEKYHAPDIPQPVSDSPIANGPVPEIGAKVVYAHTEHGKSIEPLIIEIHKWAEKHREKVFNAN